MNKTELAQGALRLSASDRLDLVEQIWESLDAEAVPVPDWQLKIVESRVEKAKEHPERFTRWEDARARILDNIRKSSS